MSLSRWIRVLSLLAGGLFLQGGGQVLALKVSRVLDPASGLDARHQILLVEEGRIRAIGSDITIPKDAQILDLGDRTIMPGLMDAHTHLCATVDRRWDMGDFWVMAILRPPGFRAIQGAAHARQMLEAGFTTVRDMGNAGEYLDMDLEKAIRFGIVPGPAMIASGRIIAPFGGQFWDNPANKEHLQNPEYRFADSQDELRKAIRENIYYGAKVIKIVVDGKPYAYPTEDIRFVVKEASEAGLKVAAHVQTERGARRAIEAGVASIEHAWVLTDEDLVFAKKQGVTLVSTDFTEKVLRAADEDVTADGAEILHRRYVERLRRARLAGVNVVFGTDIMVDIDGETRGTLAIEYVDSFLEAGYAPLEILAAMTGKAATLLGVAGDRGAIRTGMAADLVATAGDPSVDIHQLTHIDFVMKDGRIIKRP